MQSVDGIWGAHFRESLLLIVHALPEAIGLELLSKLHGFRQLISFRLVPCHLTPLLLQ